MLTTSGLVVFSAGALKVKEAIHWSLVLRHPIPLQNCYER